MLNSLSAGNSLYVLSTAENQTSAPIVTLDLQCAGGRYQALIHDSVSLGADGSARRAGRITHTAAGQTTNSSYFVAMGTWAPYTGGNGSYYRDGAGIELSLAPQNYNGTGYVMQFRFKGTEALTNLGAMGGSCPGFTDRARSREFGYNRR